ncbi:MAG: PIG-L family deacetylase [Granulosicoccus sp.]
MSLEERRRLDNDLCSPRIVQLHLALTRLRSCVKFMNSGAHPDDETSAMLAALAYRDGIDTSYACANRGEGGQNDIGRESSAVLGTLRTAEMEAAAKALDLRLYWLSTHPKDSIFDFGFSKSGKETLERWGHERTLQRFVSIVRREQPDILCPTFLDIPGQHGHHRAMTSMAFDVMEKAADKHYQIDHSNDPAWQISKLFLPAWGGGGSAYDDEVPPPEQTLQISANGGDPVTGWTWENIGQQSRRYHLTQGMGRWVKSGEERNWPLHLAATTLDASCEPSSSLHSGLAYDLAQWAKRSDDDALASALLQSHEALIETVKAFPDFNAVTQNGFAATRAISHARQFTQDLSQQALDNRLVRKQAQLARVITLASGVKANAWTPRHIWRPGDSQEVKFDIKAPDIPGVHCDIQLSGSMTMADESPWTINDNTLSLNSSAKPSAPYPDTWFADEPEGPVLEIRLSCDSASTLIYQPLELPPVILPDVSAQLTPDAVLVNLANTPDTLNISINRRFPVDTVASFSLPEGWSQETIDSRLTLRLPSSIAPGLYELPLELDEHPASCEQLIHYPHIKPIVYCQPARLRIRAIDVELPDVRIAYVGGGNDKVGSWLRAMGFSVVELSDSDLIDADTLTQALCTVDTLVVGVFAYRMKSTLANLSETINNWVAQGGHLLTLYHRPWDNWDPDVIPPARIEIGQPSLRFRVTDENAAVHYLQDSHPVLNIPNVIEESDWEGWHKERGLYFAKSWDDKYTPLLSMSDHGESPHEGALLVAEIGKGRHIHTALILHHQMDQLVPGAFRLMANLVS